MLRIIKLFSLLCLLLIPFISGCSKKYKVAANLVYTDNHKPKPVTNFPQVSNFTDWSYLYPTQDVKVYNFDFPNILNIDLKKKVSLGSSYSKIDTIPNVVTKGNLLYAFNSSNELTIFNLDTLKVESKTSISSFKSQRVTSLSYNNDMLYVTTNIGTIASIYPDGSENWNIKLLYPSQTIPLIVNGKMYVVAANTMYAINIFNGDIVWQVQGLKSGVTLKRIYTPTIYLNYIIAGLSNGYVKAFRTENGQEMWNFPLGGNKSVISNSIIASPSIIDKNQQVLISSYNDSTALIDLFSKDVSWENDTFGYINNPLIINDKIFIINNVMELNSINLNNGKPEWVLTLPINYKHISNLEWFGPILMNNYIVLYNSYGELFVIDLEGNIKKTVKLKMSLNETLNSNYIVVNKKLILFSSHSNLFILE